MPDDKKTLEMRVAELEDKLAQVHITEEEMATYNKVAAKLGAAQPCQTAPPPPCVAAQPHVQPCVAQQCQIYHCIIRCIRPIYYNDCIRPITWNDCIGPCAPGNCATGGSGGGGFGGLGG